MLLKGVMLTPEGSVVYDEGPGEGDEAGGDRQHEDGQLQVGVHALVYQLGVVDSGQPQ